MASIKIIQRDKPLKNGSYPIVLQIIKDRKRKLISLGWNCSKEEFSNGEFTKKYRGYKKRNEALFTIRLKAERIVDEFVTSDKNFTLDQFERKFRGKDEGQIAQVHEFFRVIIEELERSNRLGNARAYKETMQSFQGFLPNDILLSEVTPTVLNQYEVYMRERGNCDGGIAFKMRHLRALYNKAIERGVARQNDYPFKLYKVSKLKRKSPKRALTIEEFKKFKSLDLTMYPHLENAYNYFLFSFYTRGINFVDMMLLRWSDINDGKLVYTRSKTGKNFVMKLLPESVSILNTYKNSNPETEFIFPILLKEGLTPRQIAHRKKKTLQRFNSDLKEIAKHTGIPKTLTSYVARHSYGTILKQKGVSVEVISEAMGHANVEITKTYLKEFDADVIDKANEILSEI